jgi:hypothetical protein
MLAAASAVVDIDARLLDYSSNESTGEAELLLIQEWRRPGLESALLRVKIHSSDTGTRLDTSGDILASFRGTIDKRDDFWQESEPESCTPCEAARNALDTGERVNNARAIANLRQLTSAFITAFDQQLEGACRPPGEQAPAS